MYWLFFFGGGIQSACDARVYSINDESMSRVWLWWWRCLRFGFEGLDASGVVGYYLLQVVNLHFLFLDVIIEFRHIQIFLDLRLRLASSFSTAF